MTLNPELQRNLWLELTPARLVAAPLVLGLVFILAWQVGGAKAAAGTAQVLFFLVAVFWGARRAAASLGDEVSGATWDGQRMSALGAWEMAWGKLIGGTAFVWYCAMIILGVGFAADFLDGGAELARSHLQERVLSGLLAQSIALLTGFALLRKLRPVRALPVTLAQVFGIVVGAAGLGTWLDLFGLEYIRSRGDLVWYGSGFDGVWFLSATQAFLLFCALVGVFRLVRVELQFRTWPWCWAAFTLSLMAFAQGFLPKAGADGPVPLLLPAFSIGFLLVYVALLAEPKSVIAFRGLLESVLRRDWHRAGQLLPLWAVGSAILVPVALVLAIQLGGRPIGLGSRVPGAWGAIDAVSVIAWLLFLARDVGLFLLLSFGAWHRRGDVAGLIWLGLAYGILPGLLHLAELEPALVLFVPIAGLPPLLALGPVAVELALVCFALIWRLTRESREGLLAGSKGRT